MPKLPKKARKIVCRVPSMDSLEKVELMMAGMKSQGYTNAVYRWAWECKHYHIFSGPKS